jgi:ADP-ribosyl-[dinitrogen reductase] hydrolase
VRVGTDRSVTDILGWGAAYGASAVPAEWRRVLHDWPGLQTRDLVDLASKIIRKREPDHFDFTYAGYELGTVARHPYDDGVWLGDIGALRSLPESVDAVVSLCRVGNADLPTRAEQIDVRLIDQPDANDHLDFVLLDTVRVIEQLRREGRTVLIHCVQAQSRTPAVATLYGARLRGIGIVEALAEVCDVLPHADPIPEFCEALRRLYPVGHENRDG